MAKMKTGVPAQKVTFATAMAALATITAPLFGNLIPGLDLEQFQVEFVTVVTFLAGYLMPPSKHDEVDVD